MLLFNGNDVCTDDASVLGMDEGSFGTDNGTVVDTDDATREPCGRQYRPVYARRFIIILPTIINNVKQQLCSSNSMTDYRNTVAPGLVWPCELRAKEHRPEDDRSRTIMCSPSWPLQDDRGTMLLQPLEASQA